MIGADAKDHEDGQVELVPSLIGCSTLESGSFSSNEQHNRAGPGGRSVGGPAPSV